jgi:hypothetical protein
MFDAIEPYVDDGLMIYVCEGLVTFKISWWKWPIPEVGFGKCLICVAYHAHSWWPLVKLLAYGGPYMEVKTGHELLTYIGSLPPFAC